MKLRFQLMNFLFLGFFLAGCSQNHVAGKNDEVQMEKIHLEFFTPKLETVSVFDELISEFEHKNPTIDIEQVTVPDGMAVLKTRITRGDIPDIFVTYPIEQDYVLRANKGYLMDLTDEPFIQKVEPNIQNRFLVDGKMYGVAITQNAVGVLYNKDIFNELNLEIPDTWNEFLRLLKTLKSEGRTPILMPNNDAGQMSVFNLNFIANEFDSDYWDKVNNGEVKIEGNQTWERLSDKMLEVVSNAQDGSFNEGYNEVNESFAKGEGAMYIMGTWVIPEIEKVNSGLNYGIFPFPSTNNPEQNKVLGGVDIGISISAETAYPNEAKKFLDFLLTKENAQTLINYEGSISAIKDVKTDKEEVKELEKFILEGKSTNWPNHYWNGGSGAESDFRNYTFDLFLTNNVDKFLKNLDHMFADYRTQNLQ